MNPPAPRTMNGGCQCGAVRFAVETERREAAICHCAMCRRAVGNIFMSELVVPAADVRWQGEPKTYASSPIATRGFCGHCGTPLSFRYNDSDRISLLVGAIDQAGDLHPVDAFAVESRLENRRRLDGLREQRADEYQPLRERWLKSTGHVPE